MRKVSRIIAALVLAALTLTVSVTAASAHEFVASKTGTITTTNEGSESIFRAEIVIDCAKVTGEAKITALKFETLKETIKYSECTGGGTEVTVSPAYYEFNANGSFKLEKNLTFHPIGYGCEYLYEKQTLNSFSYTNVSKGVQFYGSVTKLIGYGTGGKCGGEFSTGYFDTPFYTKLTGGTLEWK